jgi:tetratricopeptide (TPR) repeat protein
MLANRDVPTSEVKLQIERLKELFPNHQKDLELISASLLDAHAASSALYKALSHTEQSEKFQVSLQCARIAVSLGLIWEGTDFFNIMLNTEGYKNLCKYQQIDILIEVATNLENTDSRHEARLIWVQLEALAIGTSKLEDVWQARGNCSFDHEQYVEALDYYDKCLAVVRLEDALIDQRLSSIYAFRSSCFGALFNYQAAYDNAVKAKQYFPMEDFDAFNLEYNHGFFAICLKKYKEARSVLTRAKTLARTEEEKDSVDELLSILAMKKEMREAYLKQILYNFDA